MTTEEQKNTILGDLRQLLAMTASALGEEFTFEAAASLLAKREVVIARIIGARKRGDAWGAEESELLQQVLDMDRRAVEQLEAPNRESFAWLKRREEAKAKRALEPAPAPPKAPKVQRAPTYRINQFLASVGSRSGPV